MDLGLKGRKALVTGATRGIGRAIAEALADEGCDVGICARNPQSVAEAVAALSTKGVKATGRAVDVGDGAALKAWIEASAATLGGLDILVSNVSAMGGLSGVEGWRRYFEIDVLGTVQAVEAARPFLEKSNAGAIVVIASIAAIEVGHDIFPDGFLQAYGAMKAALTNYSAELSRTLGPKGIRANAVSPGPIYFPGGVWHKREQERNPMYEKAKGHFRLGRFGRPEDVARAVAFLASPAAGFISGANLVVDGAFTRRVN
ncbi:MAG: 3-ketoacyl-ACP reductase [Betaproteobacteria bacterium RIFCSPHIGHO2_12_FULL_69_13]|nr:MAG: 3-ketoacyl-ACP reductase [Betaproteobacteria bacterium RIFCSPHIGHO2_12_FULL_69_13]OGA67576.1 MAG: 3-ketoacyl-ACP reductase [Betaproteobacteria bacterium RIFCSPLOWO2_12_FULL_68_20]